MITVKAGELISIVNALDVLKSTEGLPVKGAYWVAKMFKEFKKRLEEWNESRIELISPYCDKNENGEFLFIKWDTDEEGNQVRVPANRMDPAAEFSVPADNRETVADIFKELCEVDVEIPYNPISLNLLGDAKVPVEVFEVLDGVFTDE